MNTQRRLDVDPQACLFGTEDLDRLEDIAAQASKADREALAQLRADLGRSGRL